MPVPAAIAANPNDLEPNDNLPVHHAATAASLLEVPPSSSSVSLLVATQDTVHDEPVSSVPAVGFLTSTADSSAATASSPFWPQRTGAAAGASDAAELRSVSVKLDGRASIEHQLDIHVLDLAEAADNEDIAPLEVLQGLRYVMEYRISGGKMPNLDPDLMARLLEALLHYTADVTGSLLSKKLTEEADIAFTLFGEFTQEVDEFRAAVGRQSATDLRRALAVGRRCAAGASDDQRQDAAAVLRLLTTRFVQFRDWHDLVAREDQNDVAAVLKEFAVAGDAAAGGDGAAPVMPPVDHELFPPPALYFDKNAKKLADMFQSDVTSGLASSRVAALTDFYGRNALPAPAPRSPLLMLLEQLSNFMVIILILAAVAEFATGDPKAAAVLLAVVVLNVTIGFVQELKASKALEALRTLSVPKATVIRDGIQQEIDSAELVPGDLVVLEEGGSVPADLRLCDVAQLEIVEAILTGESVPVVKSIRTIRQRTRKLPLGDCKGNAFMATVVARGRGKGIVVRVGENTEIGRISKAITSAPHVQTPIQKSLGRLGVQLVILSVLLCALVVGVGIAYRNDAVETVKTGISLAVSVIPEGLVAVVTVTMAIAVSRMAAKHALVKKLPSVETLGAVSHICSDKTGTLTEGKMGVSELWTADNSLFVHDYSSRPKAVLLSPPTPLTDALRDPSLHCGGAGETPVSSERTAEAEALERQRKETASSLPPLASPTDGDTRPSPAVVMLAAACMVAGLCNNASLERDDEPNSPVAKDTKDSKTDAPDAASGKQPPKATGDPTEVAMVDAGRSAGLPREWFEARGLSRVGEFAFDSDRKMMSVVCVGADGGAFGPDAAFVLVKGAPESVLQRCTAVLSPPPAAASLPSALAAVATDAAATAAAPLSEEYVRYLSDRNASMAARGLRVLALALRRVDPNLATEIAAAKDPAAAESGLTFVGLVGMIDPPKQGVRESIASCRHAGIKVIMITGDHAATAAAIATQLGILDPGSAAHSRVMKGAELDMLSEEALADARPFPSVFARVSPDNKLKIVRALQRRGRFVAMTGDGVNDAPAIKQADVGVAMGRAGTEITKQAADVVLEDDDFNTVVAAVREGRLVFDNIKKFIVYLLSCNGAEILLFLAAAIGNIETPFSTIQILWANIIADIPPAMSIGVEPEEVNIMDRPPRDPKEGVLTAATWLVILAQALTQSLLTLAAYLLSLHGYIPGVDTLRRQRSLAFAALTTMQLGQAFLSRSVELSVFVTGVTGNWWMVGCVLGSFAAMLFGIYIPGLDDWLELEGPGSEWYVIVACVVVQLAAVELTKLALRAHLRRRRAAAAAAADSARAS